MNLLQNMRWQDGIDILVITVLFYRLFVLLKGTRAFQLVKGLLLLALLASAVKFLALDTLSWLLSRVLSLTLLALPIVFQPELRKILEEIGRANLWRGRRAHQKAEVLVEETVRALSYLKAHKIGALVVLQRGTGLRDFWRTAVTLNAEITQELLISIFWVNNPLHDGAVILSTERIIAAGCYLPLTEDADLSRWLGTRHRAAIGVTEVSDAISLVVSEERGEISMALGGKISRDLKEERLRKLLLNYFTSGSMENRSWLDALHDEIKNLGGGSVE